MIDELTADMDPSLRSQYGRAKSAAEVDRTAGALEKNGFVVRRAATSGEAKEVVLSLIPSGAEVLHGASQTLQLTGITEAIERSERYRPIRPRISGMDRQAQADEIRWLAAAPEVMLGSVHAVTETGSLMAASASGSQLGPYVSGAAKVILVVGIQKIVASLEEGLRRINEYAFPLEDARAQEAYGVHSGINKVLIINREINPGRITVVLVDQVIGF
ncbi:MAG TPA: LUD domain-containing protein [Candidatus Dormibacteraeota bacterium]|nr:LUD domain-containing protein [Candidatus Dormibacteraeota bacterium]